METSLTLTVAPLLEHLERQPADERQAEQQHRHEHVHAGEFCVRQHRGSDHTDEFRDDIFLFRDREQHRDERDFSNVHKRIRDRGGERHPFHKFHGHVHADRVRISGFRQEIPNLELRIFDDLFQPMHGVVYDRFLPELGVGHARASLGEWLGDVYVGNRELGGHVAGVAADPGLFDEEHFDGTLDERDAESPTGFQRLRLVRVYDFL